MKLKKYKTTQTEELISFQPRITTDNFSGWGLVKNPLKDFLPKNLQLMCKIISKNRKSFIERLDQVYRVEISLETYTYRQNLELNAMTISNLKKTRQRVKNFFKIAAKNIKAEIADIMLVSPENLNDVCNFFFIKR